LVWLTIPIFSKIPVPVTTCSSGVLENNLDAIYEVRSNPLLLKLTIFGILASFLVCYFSLYVIHMTNAMQKIMLALLKSIIMWVFFMLYDGEGHEEWSWVKALGMLLLVFGTIWFVKMDIQDIECQSVEIMTTRGTESQLQMIFNPIEDKYSIKSADFYNNK
jgi:hypothetical protein